MADCEETLRELYSYLDHELQPNGRQAIEAHLSGCMDCLQAFHFQAELRTVIAKKCREHDVPPGLLEKVRNCFGIDGTV